MHCTQCGNLLEAGTRFCDECGAPVAAAGVAAAGGNPSTVAVAAPAVQPAMKPCPFCGEQILQVANRCRYCNSDLSQPPVPQTGGSVVVQGPQLPPGAQQPTIIVQNVQTQQGPAAGMVRDFKNPGVALLLSIIFPGGGQFYNGHAGKGIIVLLTFWMILPYLWSWFDAYNSAKRINRVGF